MKRTGWCPAQFLAVVAGPMSGSGTGAEERTGGPVTGILRSRPLALMSDPERFRPRRATRGDVEEGGDARYPPARPGALDDVFEIIYVGGEAGILYPVKLPF